jgi:RHS repeat-associated protein
VQDYYAFGMQMPGRKSSGGYRYGFNGKENDNEVKGEGNSQDYGWRIHDPRIGRFLSVDPLAEKNNFESPYVFVHNNPLIYVDPDGRDGIIVIKGGQININANIYAYGAGATKAVVAQMQKDINSRWGGNFSAQTSDGKQKFNVNVNVSIGLY